MGYQGLVGGARKAPYHLYYCSTPMFSNLSHSLLTISKHYHSDYKGKLVKQEKMKVKLKIGE